jgi:outer membrane protein assembly factor BamB
MLKLKSPRDFRWRAARRCGMLASLLGLACICPGADWPQYRGPNHDGTSPECLASVWSGSVTTAVWRVTLGQAYSSFVVAQGKAVTQVYRSSKETCIALSITNGAELWSRTLETGQNYEGYNGPRSTPTIEQDSVYTLTSNLKLFRLNLTTGAVVWSNNLVAAYGASIITWAGAASPLLDGGRIYVNLNTGDRALAAFWATNGALAWRVEDETMTHSTPVAATLHGTRQIIFATQSGLVAVNATTGAKLWSYAYPGGFNGTCLGASPVVSSNVVFISQSYPGNSTAARIDLNGGVWSANYLWDQPIGMIWMTPVACGGAIYGPTGNNSSTTTPLVCLDLMTGTVLWSYSGFGRGSVARAGDLILGLTEAGRLRLIRPDPSAYTELASFRALTAGDCWNAFAISDGKVYARSTTQGACFDLSLTEAPSALAVGPASLDLGFLQAGDCASGSFFVTNTGGGTLTGTVTGAVAPFSIASGGSYSLTSNQWQAVVVQYCPTVPGSNDLSLTFTGGSGTARLVTGAAYPAPALAIGPASLNFGFLQVGDCASGNFYVTNTGGGTLTGSVSGAVAPFSIASGGSYSLASNQWQAVVVQYCPTVPGSNDLNLTFTGGSGAGRAVTGAAYPKPCLTLDPPQPAPGNLFELTVRTVNGTPLDSNRLAGMEVRASINLALALSAWPKLTNTLLLTNGVGRVLDVEGSPPRQYFIVRESQ